MATVYKETLGRVIGDDWDFFPFITVTDANGVTTPATGLTTATIVSSITDRDTNDILWTGTRAGGQITVTDDPNGGLKISVPRASTALPAAPAGTLYDMDVRVTSGTPKVTPLRWYVLALPTSSP
jgi:hypothetical protein